MSTTSNFSSNAESTRPCSARVEYKDRQGVCQRDGKYPDPDGSRWWCGLHSPDRKTKVKEAAEPAYNRVVDMDVLAGMNTSEIIDIEITSVLEAAQRTLIEISNIRVDGWSSSIPIESYKTMMTHMSDMAKKASEAIGEQLSKLK